ncbi:unnamed protein product, partial [Ectocarpus sp. 12 AP-2014]
MRIRVYVRSLKSAEGPREQRDKKTCVLVCSLWLLLPPDDVALRLQREGG